jgi:hypothetical protein
MDVKLHTFLISAADERESSVNCYMKRGWNIHKENVVFLRNGTPSDITNSPPLTTAARK